MPASMISDAVGGRWNVIGSSMAMVATGPMPGSTPISVPTMQPSSAYSRFCMLTATVSPRKRLFRRSISPNSLDDGDVHPEPDLEDDDRQDRQHDNVADHLHRLEFLAAQRGDQHQRHQRRKHTGTFEQQGEHHDADGHHGDRLPFR